MDIKPPATPMSVAETGLSRDMLLKLLAKTLYVHGTMTPAMMSAELRVASPVVSELIKDMQRLMYVEAKGLAGQDMRSELRYAIGGNGVQFAIDAFAQSQYVGPAPVTLQSLSAQIQHQSIKRERISRADLESHLSHLVLDFQLIDHLGPAVNSGRSILLYGKPGNGKTSIAEAIGSCFEEEIYLPYCFEVGGQIVNFYDPTIHHPAEVPAAVSLSRPVSDPRWVLCKRPFVLTGGELTLDMLDLAYNPVSRFYEAPMHFKATGGVFVVDDFGRQRTEPQSVLNRWIVPLERGFDQLTLHTGKKFAVPFDQLVIFSTNIPPESLADAGGLRRLYYKIQVPVPTAQDFKQIFLRAAEQGGVGFSPDDFDEFFRSFYVERNVTPAGHHPRYIIEFALSACRFREEPARLDVELMRAGWENMNIAKD